MSMKVTVLPAARSPVPVAVPTTPEPTMNTLDGCISTPLARHRDRSLGSVILRTGSKASHTGLGSRRAPIDRTAQRLRSFLPRSEACVDAALSGAPCPDDEQYMTGKSQE